MHRRRPKGRGLQAEGNRSDRLQFECRPEVRGGCFHLNKEIMRSSGTQPSLAAFIGNFRTSHQLRCMRVTPRPSPRWLPGLLVHETNETLTKLIARLPRRERRGPPSIDPTKPSAGG